MLGQNLPGAHIEHCVASATEYVPGVQAIILVESDVLGQAEPGGQGVHVVAPALLYVPREKYSLFQASAMFSYLTRDEVIIIQKLT